MIHNEYKALKGKYHSTTGYLFVILFIAFLAFGFAKSTLDCQQKLSADPFSNWINFNYHSGTRDSLLSLNEKTCSEIFREEFHIRGAYFYNRGMVSVAAISPGILPLSYEARTIDPRSDVVKDLLKTGVCAKYFPDSVENGFDCEPNGVVISKKLLDEITMGLLELQAARDFMDDGGAPGLATPLERNFYASCDFGFSAQ